MKTGSDPAILLLGLAQITIRVEEDDACLVFGG